MNSKNKNFNNKQLIFQELFVGSLIYIAVLGLFNNYTPIVEAKSFSTILLASIILELLTFITFLFKNKVIFRLKDRSGIPHQIIKFFCVWLIMFLSKFVFIGAINFVFNGAIIVNGFFGILFVVLGVTITHQLAFYVFKKLGNSTK